jgi:hypothetical protein
MYAHIVRAMSRNATEREQKIIFRKIKKNQKSRIERSQQENAKSRAQKVFRNF